jgi:hypothetical protein
MKTVINCQTCNKPFASNVTPEQLNNPIGTIILAILCADCREWTKVTMIGDNAVTEGKATTKEIDEFIKSTQIKENEN